MSLIGLGQARQRSTGAAAYDPQRTSQKPQQQFDNENQAMGIGVENIYTPQRLHSGAKLAFESEYNIVQAGMRLPHRFISVQVSGGA
jgi:hypothetical protein